MPQEKLDLAGLSKLGNGIIDAAFRHEIANAVADIHDRPGVDKPRVVTITVAMVPEQNAKGFLDAVQTSCKISSSVPKRESVEYRMLAAKNTLLFQEESPEDPRQPSLHENPDPQQ